MAEVTMEEALRAGDVLGGARDGFGAYGLTAITISIACSVIPCSIGRTSKLHAVLAHVDVIIIRLTLSPVCE